MPRLFTRSESGFGSPSLGCAATATNNSSLPIGSRPYSSDRGTAYSSSPLASPSVRLSCASPSGKSVHSLAFGIEGSCSIESHSLPLVGTVDQAESIYDSKPFVIRTQLPDKVSSALSRYPAVELLCVDVTSSVTTPQRDSSAIFLPLLCLYTKKDVFLLQLCYEPTGALEIEGSVVSVSEPYEDFLMGNAAANIIAIHQAPQEFKGYATSCPPGAIAMLTKEKNTNSCNLCLFHGVISSLNPTGRFPNTSHDLLLEEENDPMQSIVDFSFCRSNELSILSSLTVAFLHSSGRITFMTPILFSSTVVLSTAVARTVDFLDATIKVMPERTAYWNQYIAAKRFIMDAFPNNGRSDLVKTAFGDSDLSSVPTPSLVFDWPVTTQGPLVIVGVPEDGLDGKQSVAKSIVPFAGADDLVGFAVGFTSAMVGIAVASPSMLVPRFQFELEDDRKKLDEDILEGACVELIELYDGKLDAREFRLIPDPIMQNVFHFVTPQHVLSVSTNAAQIAFNNVREDAIKAVDPSFRQRVLSPPSKYNGQTQKTSGWSCLDIPSGQDSITGAVVSSDVQFGHVLVVKLRNGGVHSINLTEKRHMYEMESQGGGFSAPDLAVQQISQASLGDVIQPLVEKLFAGISDMAQIAGSATAPKDITVNGLAGAMSIYENCKRNVYLPLAEINERVSARQVDLHLMIKKQLEAAKALKELIGTVRERQAQLREESDIVISNSKSLEMRCSSALQSCRDLQPTITQSEYDYFQELKRLDTKTTAWELEAEIIKLKTSSIKDDLDRGNAAGPMSMSKENLTNSMKLLKACGAMIDKQKAMVQSLEGKVDGLAAYAGYISQPDNVLPINH